MALAFGLGCIVQNMLFTLTCLPYGGLSGAQRNVAVSINYMSVVRPEEMATLCFIHMMKIIDVSFDAYALAC